MQPYYKWLLTYMRNICTYIYMDNSRTHIYKGIIAVIYSKTMAAFAMYILNNKFVTIDTLFQD